MGEITLVTDFFDIGRRRDKNEELRRTASSILMSSDVGQIQNKLIIVYGFKRGARDNQGNSCRVWLLDKTVIVATDNLFELEGDLTRMEKASKSGLSGFSISAGSIIE